MKRILILSSILLLAVVAGRWHVGPVEASETAGSPAPKFDCLNPPSVSSDLPADSLLTEQPEVNCFAWQEFIALNWAASPTERGAPDTSVPASKFGDPGPGTKVWETFKSTEDLFPAGGVVPKPWNAPTALPPVCEDDGLSLKDGQSMKVLQITAKFNAGLNDRQVLDEINEAGVEPPAWLTAQSGHLVHYEVLVNEDYFNYVVDPENAFYDARNQAVAVQPGGQGIDFPVGPSQYGPTGAIELKAGWLEIDAADRDRFLTTEAILVDGQDCRHAMVGLVGLHIVHKTKSMPNWTWATFEHVENAPNRIDVNLGNLHPPYTFFNPDCDSPDAPECIPNRKPEDGDPMDRPIQVVREVPIPPYVTAVNEAVWQTIRASNTASVFQHYRLVNTLWPQSGEELSVGSLIPLNEGGAAPTTGLSNVTAETYAQDLTCLTCHRSAAIACSSTSGPNPRWGADYSFQLSRATEANPPTFCGGGD